MPGAEAPRRPRWVTAVSEAFTENIGLKVSSIVIAMALFGLVRGAGNVERTLEVNLLTRTPALEVRRVLLTDLPDRVRVTVQGPPSLVGAVRAESVGGVMLDLTDGRRPVARIDPSTLQLPAGVRIREVQPSSLQLSWEDLVDREVPVRAETVGQSAAGTKLATAIDVQPARVRVSGPALYVNALSVVRTDPIDVTGLEAGQYQRRVALEAPRAHLQFESALSARVIFTIERDLVERRIEHLEVTVVGATHVTLRPTVVTLRVRGLAQAVAGIDPALVLPTVDVTEPIASGRESVRLRVNAGHLPQDVELVGIEPPEVIVTPTH